MTGNVYNGSSNLEIAQSNQDLIKNKTKKKKRTWIVIGILSAIVIILIISTIFLLSNNQSTTNNENLINMSSALSLEDIIYGHVNPKPFNATWVSGNELLYIDDNRNLILRNMEGNSTKILLNAADPILGTAFKMTKSADSNYLLIAYHFQKIYRYSYRAKYVIINLKTNEKISLKLNDSTDFNLFEWSSEGNGFVFVHEYNIFYKSNVNSDPIQITNDNSFIYNGIPDWVNEEEVFASNKALWFSIDGKKLIYGRFDDTKTQLMVLPIYGEPGNLNFQYTRANLIKYPKPGTPNPIVTLHFVDLNNITQARQLPQPTEFADPILTNVEWATNGQVLAIWMNRVQNQAMIVSYFLDEHFSFKIIKHLIQDNGWLELFSPPLFSKDGLEFALILSQDQGDLGGYRHITLLKMVENSTIRAVTKGAFVVTQILGWNHANNLLYYLANTEEDSAVQHLYSISPDGSTRTCLSCGLRSENNRTECLYNSAVFSIDYSHYLLYCEGPGVPKLTIHSVKSNKTIEWESNQELINLKHSRKTPEFLRFSLDIADGMKAQIQLKLPPNIDISGKIKYPMLINVYAGPDSYQVVERFNLDWGSYLAANKSIIYGMIDGRGSGLRGDKILFSSYRRLGTVEIIDQINVTRQLQLKLPYIDETRTAIWGWSYGGYAAGMALANDKEGVFKCGISVAPVTDWTLYDSIYTERFMGLPTIEDNYQGYYEASLLTKYRGFKDKQYFLIHGTYDDNVHYQQSMLWSKVLEKNDILFRQLSYPDEDHGLSSVRPHFYHSLEQFLDECFIGREM